MNSEIMKSLRAPKPVCGLMSDSGTRGDNSGTAREREKQGCQVRDGINSSRELVEGWWKR